MKVIGCIPARFGSTRLPGKPLADIHGKPMVVRVVERAAKAKKLDDLVVLTDDQRVVEAVENAGFKAVMTSASCRSGTERLIDYLPQTDADCLLNIQGDEVSIDPEHIDALVDFFQDKATPAMGTLAFPETDAAVFQQPSCVKVVLGEAGRALYFSRNVIPMTQLGNMPESVLIHMGIYIYHRQTLEQFKNLPITALEQIESLEQLRALYYGLPIYVAEVLPHQALAVDTEADLLRARQLIADNG